MNLVAAKFGSSIVDYLNSNQYKLDPELARLRVELGGAALGSLSDVNGAIQSAIKTGPNSWRLAHNCFWEIIFDQPVARPVEHRVAINPPNRLTSMLGDTSHYLAAFAAGNLAGEISHAVRLQKSRGEDLTFHADDLTVFCLNGYTEPKHLVDLASLLKPGSTVTIYYPTEAHRLMLTFFRLVAGDLLLDALDTKYKVTKVFEELKVDWYTQVFGLE